MDEPSISLTRKGFGKNNENFILFLLTFSFFSSDCFHFVMFDLFLLFIEWQRCTYSFSLFNDYYHFIMFDLFILIVY
jgi:hypothetical protein